MRTIILVLTITSVICATPVFAWNAVGHRVIAQIAYDQLTPRVKATVDSLTRAMFYSSYGDARFARAAVWPDKIRENNPTTSPWHFIDLPITQSGVKAAEPHAKNVVWSILHAEKTLENPHVNNMARAKSLSFLIHFVGDIHQPLHCAELFNPDFPTGDKGGNLYPIRSPFADNLHAFWDSGAGLFARNPVRYQFHYYQIQQMALQWMKRYPRSFFANRLPVQSPRRWAQESHHIADLFAYTTPMNQVPSTSYVQQSQVIVQEQAVLAGDRLADLLNRILP